VRKGKILEGKVIADKLDKTITVMVGAKLAHQLYKRSIIKRKKYKVHDAQNRAKVGDRVRIVESRPFSKEKRFKLHEIVK